MNIYTIITIFVSILIVAYLIQAYNRIIFVKNQVDRAFSNIDVILKQRFDEVPQLIKIIEQTANYEKKMIDKILAARAVYLQAKDNSTKLKAVQDLNQSLTAIFAIGENYPDLKSNQSFLQLQNRLSDLENHLADRRETYNESVANYNTVIHQVPEVFFSNQMKLQNLKMYEVDKAHTVMPSLNIGT